MFRRVLVVVATALILFAVPLHGVDAQDSGATPPTDELALELEKAPPASDRAPDPDSAPWIAVNDDLAMPADLVFSRPFSTEQALVGQGFAAVDGFVGNRGMYWIRLASSNVASNTQVESLRVYAELAAQRLSLVTGGTYRVASGIVDLSGTGVDPAVANPVSGEILVVVSNTSPCAAGWLGCGGPEEATTDPNNAAAKYLTSGKVWLHPSVLPTGGGFDSRMQHIMEHELGHAVGLMHFDELFESATQLMHSSSLDAPTYRSGDINGLTYLHPSGPSNDDFGAATPLVGAKPSATQVTFGATAEAGEPDHDGTSSGSSVWFTWTPGVSGEAQFTTFLSTYDTNISVYTGSAVSGLSLVGRNDDFDATNRFSLLDLQVQAGTTYRIAVDGVFGDAGVLVLSVQEPQTGQMTPVSPFRVLETRPTSAGAGITQTGYAGAKPTAGQTIQVQVTGNGGVPAGATAAVLNVAVTQPASNGFLVVHACDQSRPTAANLNWAAGQTIPNLVIAPLDSQGRTCIYVNASTHVIADVSGYFAREGEQLTSVPPLRLLETRETNVGLNITQTGYAGAKPTAGQTIQVQVTGNGGVPTGATAAVLNVAVTQPASNGFLVVHACDQSRPTAASLNWAAGQTIPNLVIAPLDSQGRTCIYVNASTHVIADLSGYYNILGDRLRSVSPSRLLETRPTNTTGIVQTGYAGGKPTAGQTIQLQVTGRGGVPAGGAPGTAPTAAVLNIAVTQPASNGFLVVYACGESRPGAANLNWAAGQTIPNLVIAPLDSQGRTCIYVNASTHVIADVNGYYAP